MENKYYNNLKGIYDNCLKAKEETKKLFKQQISGDLIGLYQKHLQALTCLYYDLSNELAELKRSYEDKKAERKMKEAQKYMEFKEEKNTATDSKEMVKGVIADDITEENKREYYFNQTKNLSSAILELINTNKLILRRLEDQYNNTKNI